MTTITVRAGTPADVPELRAMIAEFQAYIIDIHPTDPPVVPTEADLLRDGFGPGRFFDVLIAGGMGAGLKARLARRGIDALVTAEKDPERAVQAWLAGDLPPVEPRPHAHGTDRGARDEHDCTCAGDGRGRH